MACDQRGASGQRARPAAVRLPPLDARRRARGRDGVAPTSLSHDVAGIARGRPPDAAGIQWYGYGEVIAYSLGLPASAAAAHLFQLWATSPPHWALLMSTHVQLPRGRPGRRRAPGGPTGRSS